MDLGFGTVRLGLNRPVALPTPDLPVDGLTKPGVYRFRLEVVDTAGNRSLPAEMNVVVTPPQANAPQGRTSTADSAMRTRINPQ